jgi:hypothetical protein
MRTFHKIFITFASYYALGRSIGCAYRRSINKLSDKNEQRV